MAKHENQKKEKNSEIEDLEELAQFRKKKKTQNEALNKILQKFNSHLQKKDK